MNYIIKSLLLATAAALIAVGGVLIGRHYNPLVSSTTSCIAYSAKGWQITSFACEKVEDVLLNHKTE